MNISKRLVLEFNKDDRSYRFELPDNAPLGEAYEAVGSVMTKIVQLINEFETKRSEKEDERICDKPPVQDGSE